MTLLVQQAERITCFFQFKKFDNFQLREAKKTFETCGIHIYQFAE